MTRTRVAVALAGLIGTAASVYAQSPVTPTFSKDVAPILYQNCTNCHRAGEIGPMPLISFSDARPWAKAIATRVSDGTMPPWHADPGARTVPQRPPAERQGPRDDREVGQQRRAGRQPRRPAGGAEVRRGLADRHARHDLVDAGGIPDSCQRHDRVQELRGADQPHRGQVGRRRSKSARATARSSTT